MKKSPLKRKSRTETAKLKDKLWELCKLVIRKRDGNVCKSCGKTGLEGSGWHTGHLIPDAACGAYLRHNLRNLFSQCYYCNINLGGNGAELSRNVAKQYGKGHIDKLFKDKQKITKADKWHYMSLIAEYEVYATLSKEELIEITKK